MNFGSGSDLFPEDIQFKDPKMEFLNILIKEYLNIVYLNGQNDETTPFLIIFDHVYIHFRIWTRIRNPRVTDPDPVLRIRIRKNPKLFAGSESEKKFGFEFGFGSNHKRG
jgi:hypothetical protein